MSADAGTDRWLDLIERFAARGARISVGNLSQCMIAHLLDVVEEQEVRIKALEDGNRRLSERLTALEGKDG